MGNVSVSSSVTLYTCVHAAKKDVLYRNIFFILSQKVNEKFGSLVAPDEDQEPPLAKHVLGYYSICLSLKEPHDPPEWLQLPFQVSFCLCLADLQIPLMFSVYGTYTQVCLGTE